MTKSCVTIALVPEIKKGPWVYWEPIELSIPKAKKLGFDAVELFTASAGALDRVRLKNELLNNDMRLGAVGTGAGKVIHGLTLTSPDSAVRERAVAFISDMIAFGAPFGAPAIIGSMQGSAGPDGEREQSLDWLRQGLNILGKRAGEQGIKLIYEPLNRYETDIFNQLGPAVDFIRSLDVSSIGLLADLFHMNIEETSIPNAIRDNAKYIGHVHFADSNRGPVGMGHTSMKPAAKALKEIKYGGFISAEAFPWPNPDAAARQTIKAYKKYFSHT